MVQAASLNVNLTAGIAGFESGMRRATGILQSFGKVSAKVETAFLGVAGAVKVAALGMLKQFADAGSEVFDLSKKTGASTEALSALGYAGKLSGVTLSDLGGALAKMNKNLAENEENFAALGLNFSQLRSMSTEDQFIAIADAISKIPDQATKTSVAMGIFGKSATTLFPLIDGGAASMKAATDEAKRLGLVMSADTAAKADDLGDSMDRVLSAASGLSKTISEALAPSYTKFNNTLAETIGAVSRWIKQSPEAIDLTLKLSTAFGVLAVSIFATRKALFGASVVVQAAIPVFKGLRWAVLGLATALRVTLSVAALTAMRAFGAWLMGGTGGLAAALARAAQGARLLALAFVSMTPAGIAVAIASVVGSFLAFTDTGKSLVSWIYDSLGKAFDWIINKISGFLDKLGAAGQGIKQLIGIGGQIATPSDPPMAIDRSNEIASGMRNLWAGLGEQFTPAIFAIQRFERALNAAQDKQNQKNAKTEKEIEKERKERQKDAFDSVSSLLEGFSNTGKTLEAVGSIFGTGLFKVLAKDRQKFTEEFNKKKGGFDGPNVQGPELIQAGTAAAFGIGKGNLKDKKDEMIEKNTKQTYQEIKALAAQLAEGLKVNIRNIEAFAP